MKERILSYLEQPITSSSHAPSLHQDDGHDVQVSVTLLQRTLPILPPCSLEWCDSTRKDHYAPGYHPDGAPRAQVEFGIGILLAVLVVSMAPMIPPVSLFHSNDSSLPNIRRQPALYCFSRAKASRVKAPI